MKKLAYGLFIFVFAVMLYGQNVMAGSDKVTLDLTPVKQKVAAGEAFTLTVIADSDMAIGAYDFEVNFPEDKIQITSIEAAKDGVVAAANVEMKGAASVNGFEVNGIGPGDALQLVTINGIALERDTRRKKDVALITVTPKHLTDPLGQALSSKPKVVKAKISITHR